MGQPQPRTKGWGPRVSTFWYLLMPTMSTEFDLERPKWTWYWYGTVARGGGMACFRWSATPLQPMRRAVCQQWPSYESLRIFPGNFLFSVSDGTVLLTSPVIYGVLLQLQRQLAEIERKCRLLQRQRDSVELF